MFADDTSFAAQPVPVTVALIRTVDDMTCSSQSLFDSLAQVHVDDALTLKLQDFRSS